MPPIIKSKIPFFIVLNLKFEDKVTENKNIEQIFFQICPKIYGKN